MGAKDTRNFRRYRKESPFVLRIRDEFIQAKIVDYSLDGVGIVVEDGLVLEPGDSVDLVLSEPDIEAEGTVVWKGASGAVVRIGVHTTSGLKGSIRDFRFTDTAIGLQRTRATGVLTVEDGHAAKKVYFSNGAMVFAASGHVADTLGEFLSRRGRLTPEQLARVRDELKTEGQKEGAVLVRLGFLRPHDIVISARQLVEEIIMGLFAMTEGRFRFEAMPLPQHEVISLKLSAANLIFSGIKQMDDVRFIERELPSRERIIVVSREPLDVYQDLRLDYDATRIMSCIGRGASIAEVIRSSGLAEADALKTIYALLRIKMIALSDMEPGEDAGAPPIEEISEPSSTGAETARELDPALRTEIEEMHARYDEVGYYGVLGLRQDSSLGEIKAAYYRAAKRFHPDIHFSLADDSVKDQLSDIFSYIYEAYSTLADPARRREYDAALDVKPARISTNAEKARYKFQEGRDLLRQGRFEDAERLLGQAVYFDQHVAEHHFFYGLAMVRQRKFKPAERAIGRALKIEHDNPMYITEQGFIFLELGFPSRARGLFEKALQLSPDNAPAAAGLKRAREIEVGD